MRKPFFCLICVIAVLGLTLPAQAVEVGVRGYYWFPGLDGDVKVDGNGIAGTTLDLESDLGMDDESYPIVEAFVGLGDHHLSLSFYRADYSGDKTLDQTVTFSGRTFNVSERIRSDLEYDVYDLMYQYDLLDLENILAGFSLGVVARVKVFDGSVEIKSDTTGITESEDFTAPIPMVGLNLHLGILADLLEARVLATGIGYGDGTMFDGQAEISFTPFPFLDIHGGYRTFFVDVDADDAEFNYNTSGPYVALTVSL